MFIIVSFISFLTGSYKNLVIFTLIIIVHEFGHFICGYFLGWDVEKIYIYPYGGCTKFNTIINEKLRKELFVLLAGPLFQVIFFLIVRTLFYEYDLYLFNKYNILILLFNLLPIYPLDGGKLLNILFRKVTFYKKSFFISIVVSYITILVIVLNVHTFSFIVVIAFILSRIIKEQKMINVYYNKFLLERYLYNFKFKKTKIINGLNKFYFEKKNIIKTHNGYITEKCFLNRHFKV